MGMLDYENKPHFYKVAVAGCEFFKPPRGFQKSHFGENKPNLATLNMRFYLGFYYITLVLAHIRDATRLIATYLIKDGVLSKWKSFVVYHIHVTR